jgi:nickel-dependent lactate racemase
MNITLKKGKKTLKIAIPDENVISVITGSSTPAADLDHLAGKIEQGIVNHTPKGIARKKTAVIIPDNTRAWARGDLFVPVIVKTLERLGAAKKDISIIIALGSHADMPPASFPGLAGEYCARHIRILNSANRDRSRLTRLGRTRRDTEVIITKEACDCDHIIIFGGVLHHMAAGYGGGRKYILPGIAGYDAIQQNHALTIQNDGSPHPMVGQGVLKNNPVNEDMEEAAGMFLKDKTCSYAAVAANGAGELFYAAVGDLDSTFAEACKKLDRACAVTVDQKADFAVISTGGHRTDTQLYQSTKALFNAAGVVKEGGRIIFVAGCSQGVGNDSFADVLSRYKDCPGKIGLQLVTRFSMPVYVAFRVMDLLNRFKVTLVSDLPETIVRDLGFEYSADMDDLISHLSGKGYIIPFAENVLPVAAEP